MSGSIDLSGGISLTSQNISSGPHVVVFRFLEVHFCLSNVELEYLHGGAEKM
jgi:hypothetical protein